MIKLSMKEAIKYCSNHRAVINTTTHEDFDRLMLNLYSITYTNFTQYGNQTCIHLHEGCVSGFSKASHYARKGYEIVEMI